MPTGTARRRLGRSKNIPPKRAATEGEDEKRAASRAEGAEEAARNSAGPVRQKKSRWTEIKVAPIWKSARDWIRKTVNENQSHEFWNKTKVRECWKGYFRG